MASESNTRMLPSASGLASPTRPKSWGPASSDPRRSVVNGASSRSRASRQAAMAPGASPDGRESSVIGSASSGGAFSSSGWISTSRKPASAGSPAHAASTSGMDSRNGAREWCPRPPGFRQIMSMVLPVMSGSVASGPKGRTRPELDGPAANRTIARRGTVAARAGGRWRRANRSREHEKNDAWMAGVRIEAPSLHPAAHTRADPAIQASTALVLLQVRPNPNPSPRNGIPTRMWPYTTPGEKGSIPDRS